MKSNYPALEILPHNIVHCIGAGWTFDQGWAVCRCLFIIVKSFLGNPPFSWLASQLFTNSNTKTKTGACVRGL
jgi:hypothetical protein